MDKTLNHIVDSYYQPANEVRNVDERHRTFKEYKPPQHPLGPRATTPYNKPPVENTGRPNILNINEELTDDTE